MDKQYIASTSDPRISKKWNDEKTYHVDATSSKPLFSIDTPPPTVSGSLHIGHIFSYTQTDIIARYKRMSGYNVFYPFGFDDNGLATERFVERKHNVTGHSMKRTDFISLCLKQSHESAQEFQSLWQRMGISADWSKTYSTISPMVQKISQQSFIDLYKKGFIYKKQEPALYCTSCFTSVAQAELDDIVMPSHFNDIVFTTKDGNPLTIATTRPELLPSCVALMINPNDKRYSHLKGSSVIVPIFGHEVPIIEDELVDPEKGSGLVMCCTFGDKTDILWFKKHNLPYRQSIGFDGKWLPTTGPLAGLRVAAARETIIKLLQEANLLLNSKAISHSVNVHERCKKAIEYVVLNQWFLQILNYKKEFLDAAEQVKWYPQFMYARYKDWVENLQWDWCLSRQRFYGIPFPVWHCLDCKEIIFAKEEQLPLDPQEHPYNAPCPTCKSTNIKGDTDVMDTWNTSALTPYICSELYTPSSTNPFTADTAPYLPMSMRPQAHDIIRTWAFDTIVKTWFHHKTLPWTNIVISGHVLSNDRNKISKSQGNNPLEPENLLKSYPADAIRYWTATGALGHDTAYSDNQLKIGLKLQTKLWNAFRFIKEHIQDVSDTTLNPQHALNKWVLSKLSETTQNYHAAFARNESGQALAAAERFFWQDVCDNYLELVKDQLFNPTLYDAALVQETRITLYHVGINILQLYAPYISFCTEEIYELVYQNSMKSSSLHTTLFSDVQKEYQCPEATGEIEHILAIIAQVRKLKTEKELSLKTPLTKLTITSADDNNGHFIKRHEQLLKGITHALSIEYHTLSNSIHVMEQEGEQWSAHVFISAQK